MDTKLIWSAGFMDGEGTITIKRAKRGKNGNLYHLPYISCAQVEKPDNVLALETLRGLFGGSLAYYKMKKSDGNCIDTVTWNVTSRMALDCAKKLLPYLVIKHKQAKLLIKFTELFVRNNKKTWLTDSERSERETYFWKMRDLNVKGKIRLQRLNEGTVKADVIV
jgi:hypothetical protein